MSELNKETQVQPSPLEFNQDKSSDAPHLEAEVPTPARNEKQALSTGETQVFSSRHGNGEFLKPNSKCPQTVYECFENACEKVPNAPLFGHRKDGSGPYVWETYSQVRTHAMDLSSGFEQLRKTYGLYEKASQYPVGIYSINRPEWCIVDIANCYRSAYTVGLYGTYGVDVLCYVIEHAELRMIVASSNNISNLLKQKHRLPGLKIIISMDALQTKEGALGHALKQWAESLNVVLLTMEEVEALGRQNPASPIVPGPEDLYTICYTSGTTGNPKGVLSTHWNYASAIVVGAVHANLSDFKVKVYASFLPLAHTMERTMVVNLIHCNFAIGFYRGSIPDLMDDIAEIRPSVFVAVPRILNRIYDKITAAGVRGSGLGPAVFRLALGQKMHQYKKGAGTHHMLWDSLVFSKVRKALGGRVEAILTGSAPIATEVLDFLRVVLCPVIYEGYGLTEIAGSGCITEADEDKSGHVGGATPNTEFKLVDIPEMNYLSTDQPFPRGEICFRGANVFKGYYKEPELTREVLDDDGWFHTGDVGMIEDGKLKIIDRKKNLFKLSQGEYIAPEKIENILSQYPRVAQAYVYGDSLKSSLVAVIVPDPEAFLPWAKSEFKISSPSLEDACNKKEAIDQILKDLNNHSKSCGLNGFELIKAIYLDPTPFSVDNDCLTPT
ncbi:medium-chain fatty acid-CoA ligase faa2, variant 2 [Entomophthora muscae]|nr:medium-chain fatty acid-CoA ligase faa2, variant 2 [Entomophthora muscae]